MIREWLWRFTEWRLRRRLRTVIANLEFAIAFMRGAEPTVEAMVIYGEAHLALHLARDCLSKVEA
jgi:hypothetical protein